VAAATLVSVVVVALKSVVVSESVVASESVDVVVVVTLLLVELSCLAKTFSNPAALGTPAFIRRARWKGKPEAPGITLTAAIEARRTLIRVNCMLDD